MSSGKSAFLLGLALLAGCTSASGPTYSAYTVTLPNGEPANRVTCYGLFEGPGACRKQADAICKGQPVRMLSGESRMGVTTDGKQDDRNITFQCGARAVAEPAAPAAVSSAPMLPKTVSLSADANFDTAKATLKPAAQTRLDELIKLAGGVRIGTLTVNGYTDSVGSEAYNQDLSERRARAVANYLQEHGLKAERFVSHGYGKADPVDSNATEGGRARNRRVEVMMDIGKR
ncbi:OmpA family protein [Burkholderia pyrrocinia]|uniref:OmpA family protein n=1 Tax=Burkholderia pyrrocinia TaxID=60550 RepID=UPI001575C289|nr:OmpA family protein [Burkholderia pyrrocinia]NTX25705.1 OmpA family protein [Burkholderia pyrrocinia]